MTTWKKFITDRKVYYDMRSVFLVKLIKFCNLFLNISNDIIHVNFCIIIFHTCDMRQSTGADYIIKIKNKQWPLTGTLFFSMANFFNHWLVTMLQTLHTQLCLFYININIVIYWYLLLRITFNKKKLYHT